MFAIAGVVVFTILISAPACEVYAQQSNTVTSDLGTAAINDDTTGTLVSDDFSNVTDLPDDSTFVANSSSSAVPDVFTKFSTISKESFKTTTKDPSYPKLELFPKVFRGLPRSMPREIRCYLQTNDQSNYLCPRLVIMKGWELVNYNLSTKRQPGRCTIVARLTVKKKELLTASSHEIKFRCKGESLETSARFDIIPFLNLRCNTSWFCREEYDLKSKCVENFCRCKAGYKYDGLECVLISGKVIRKGDIYKVVLVAVACFAVTTIALFTLFLCNRSLFRRRHPSPLDDLLAHRGDNDVFLISDEDARLRMADKPPTYQDVVQNDREYRGVPPPSYAVVEEPSDNTPGPGGTAEALVSELPQGGRHPQVSSSEHASIMRLAEALTRTRRQQEELARTTTPIRVEADLSPAPPTSSEEASEPAVLPLGSYDNPGFVTDV